MTEHSSAGLTGSSNTHARLSPSDSKRWAWCTASIAFQEANAHRVRKDEGSIWSDEGTEAHEWAAKVLLKQCTIEEVPEKGMLGNDLRTNVAAYTEHCLSAVGEGYTLTTIAECIQMAELGFELPDKPVFIEEQVELYYQPEQTGTADFLAIISENGYVLRFVGKDYKNGAGVLVESLTNSQLAIYIFSAIRKVEGIYKFGPETLVDLRVFQPRHREGADQEPWIVTLADLTNFCTGTDSIEYRAIQAREGANRVREKIGSPGRDVSCDEILEAAPGLVFHPEEGDGGACRFCKMKAVCPKRWASATEGMDFGGTTANDFLVSLTEPTKAEKKEPLVDRLDAVIDRTVLDGVDVMTDEFLVTLYKRSKAIHSFLGDIEEYLESKLLDGHVVPGTKLVMGRQGDRKWVDTKAADTFLTGQELSADQRYEPREVVSVTTAEKLLKGRKLSAKAKTRWSQLVSRSPAKKVLALADDKREAVTASAVDTSGFGNETGDDASLFE